MSTLIAIFFSVFFAELGDKTQVATVLFASDSNNDPKLVFLASAAALVLSSAIAVGLGVAAEKWLAFMPLKLIAGIGFIIIGAWTVYGHFNAG